MALRKIAADYIFPVVSGPQKDAIVVIDEKGLIKDIISKGSVSEPSEIERYSGVICPGFVNTHCHTELSHLKGKIAEKTGLPVFIQNLQKIRGIDKEAICNAVEMAEMEMIANGIVAVGDISNGADSFIQKSKKRLKYHTFIELIGFSDERAGQVYTYALNLLEQIKKECPHPASLVPHAPYSVSKSLLRKIRELCKERDNLLTMHNQESPEENLMFIEKKGEMLEMLESFGIDVSRWEATGKSSILSTLSNMPQETRTLLVHNTHTRKEEIVWAQEYNKNLYWCFCPSANLYIENALPDYNAFIKAKAKITIGTDSLASNKSLSILEELKLIAENNPTISLNDLFTWATKNGAEFLGFYELGTLEKAKKPGLNLIEGIDIQNLKLTKQSRVRPL